MDIIIRLLIAHLVADFLLQPYKWVLHKETHKIKSPYLLAHIGVHTLFYFLLVWDLDKWPLILSLSLAHYIIDISKLEFQKPNNRIFWFLLDQFLHMLSIALLWLYFESNLDLSSIGVPTNYLLIGAGALLLTAPVSLTMNLIIDKFNPTEKRDESLRSDGNYIGILERLCIFIFILVGEWELIGLFIIAKAIFRFNDIKSANDHKFTEYIMIGTLFSIGIAIGTGVLVKLLLTCV